jgi:hypothetical protein
VLDVETVTLALGVAGPAIVALLFRQADATARAGSHGSARARWLAYPALAVAAALPFWAAREDYVRQSLAWVTWAALGGIGLVAARRRERAAKAPGRQQREKGSDHAT